MKLNWNVRGVGDLIGHVRFYVLAIAVGLIFSAVAATAATTISTDISTGGNLSVTGTSAHTGLATFGNASSTLFSATNGLWVGSSGATSIFGSATSTFGAGISATYLNLSGTSASSTAANGINLTSGCFAVNGTCVGGSVGLTAVTGTWPIISSGGATPVISFGGLSTSTAAVIGNIPYFSGVNTFANVATTSVTCSGNTTCAAFNVLGSSPITISSTGGGTGLSTTSPLSGSNLLVYSSTGAGSAYGVATSSLTATGLLSISNAPSIIGASGAVVTLPLTKGNFIVGNDAGTAQATSTILISSTGDITPIGRLMVPMGEVNYFNTTGTSVTITTVSDGSTNLVKVAPATTLNSDGYEFDNGGANNGRLRYTGATTKMFHIAFSISMDSQGIGTNVYVFGIAKNGTVGNCKTLQSIAANGQIGSTSLHCFLSLATNDYIELYTGNITDDDDITAVSVNIFAMGM